MIEHNLLLRVKRLFDEALPKFNWGDSFLDADAIKLLNEVPQEVNRALAAVRDTRLRCIITGCQLRLAGSQEAVAGDLHVQGDVFIFNGNWSDVGTLWVDQAALGHYGKIITIRMGDHYFERRGVFVIKASRALLNDAANRHTAHVEIPA